jgi:hypothetical protein
LFDCGMESPGLVRLPVCSAEEAVRNGEKKETWDVYPCDMVEGSVAVSGASGRRSGGLSGRMLWAGLAMVP